ncbi:signal peptidase I [Allosphingosinicella sp.]|jgi:signal peptidase I|uniref:signal peptidase I n=1 Tax=Allosphingosinicella sp. TaxID=2823234 RepID=UPI003D72DE0C
MVLAVLALLGALLISVALTWRWSREPQAKLRWWSRWYSILAVVILGSVLASYLAGVAHGFYKSFYLPSEGMAPTLLKNDRLVASMTLPDVLRRGDIILFDTPAGVYIKRIAGLPGDRISMSNGVVSINGDRMEQRFLRTERVDGSNGWVEGRRLIERFPGEKESHQIYDLERSPFDDVPEQIVAAGHLFVLGDNRDRSADSRVPVDLQGVEQVPITRVHGKALFFPWGAKAGQSINP